MSESSVSLKFWLVCLCHGLWLCVGMSLGPVLHAQAPAGRVLGTAKPESAIRVATFNVSLNRPTAGKLEQDLKDQDDQARVLAAVIRLLQPDILLLNEVDFAKDARNARVFADEYVGKKGKDSLGSAEWKLDFVYDGPVNTGVASGLDLNQNGNNEDPEDAWGYGRFPGQYGMAVLSRFPVLDSEVRTLQNFKWSELPNARIPATKNKRYYAPEAWSQLRLASKSFWDVPIDTPLGKLHVLASHPTPPAFDGEEDRNGCRNHDEIKLLQHYIEGAPFLVGDDGQQAGLKQTDAFVVMGDLNSDPNDGGSQAAAIRDLLMHPRVAQFPAPNSRGAAAAARAQGKANTQHVGPAAEDTGDFNDRSVGNLRIDYVLPSANFRIVQSGVFWPDLEELPARLRGPVKECLSASDHHLVWVDLVSDELSAKVNNESK